jgi:GLPGLI family protein
MEKKVLCAEALFPKAGQRAVWLVSLALLGVSLGARAQYESPQSTSIDRYEVLDSAYIECLYELKYLKSDKHTDRVSEDLKVLQIGRQLSKFYSFYVLKHDSVCEDLIRKGADAVPNNPQKGAQGYEVFKDYLGRKFLYVDKGTWLEGDFLYEEGVPDLKWTIRPEKAVVADHLCQRATVAFRGRDYEAWFAPDIPIPDGPWKFGGLPGLILKVEDSQRHFVFVCVSIRSLREKEAILRYKLNYTKVSREELEKLYRKYHDDPTSYMESLGKELLFMGKDGVARVKREAKFPYNPIELE